MMTRETRLRNYCSKCENLIEYKLSINIVPNNNTQCKQLYIRLWICNFSTLGYEQSSTRQPYWFFGARSLNDPGGKPVF